MNITAIRTHKVMPGQNLYGVLEAHLPKLREGSILAVTSKIVAICEGRVAEINGTDKQKLIHKEAQLFLSPEENKYGITLTIKNNMLIPTAGIDESNGNGYYVLWPARPQTSADSIRAYLRKKFSLRRVGVILTDSTSSPLRWGTAGVAIAHSGFAPVKNYIGQPDIFGRKLKVTKANVAHGLAAAAVGAMGEGNEQTPLAIIEDLPFVQFQWRNPTRKELHELKIDIRDDLYAPLLKNAKWKKGAQRNFLKLT